MMVQEHGQKRCARVVWGSAAFFMAFFVLAYGAVPVYSNGIGTVACFSVITVEPGQDINALAKRYATTTDQILKDNPQAHTFTPGATLTIRENTRTEEVSRGVMVSWYWPVLGWISSDYGWRGSKDFHHGIDIALPIGTTINAAQGGQVVKAGWLGVYGLAVLIDHGNGIETLYGHNDRLFVKVGEQVKSGERIAISGNTGNTTGPHLHFEIRKNDKTVDPLDYLPKYDVARQ
ncbi:M23 family metallopeptidase [Desulfitobacterium sp.]|uniref:M23 family metallopeptidase n=1 Tax=Desulfitobacterium sp. TaxID=49981 RepID=UPI002C09927D|nr:M23 family metallopeptidase [Desulfitobacterium sp.]HVJ49199.1 M23 family metallopeptidase [Desulfitobacterium sp.]